MDSKQFVAAFREAAPYVHAHRGKTAVIAFSGAAVASEGLTELAHDVALLQALGLKIVLVHGVPGHDVVSKTDRETLEAVKAAVGLARFEIEGRLSMGLSSSPMANARLSVATGNFVAARPVGVVHGIDYGHTGEVRRIDVEGIRERLDRGAVVLLSPVGYAVTGTVFNVGYVAVAAAAAEALKADKLVFLVDGADPKSVLPAQLALDRLDETLPEDLDEGLAALIRACEAALRAGVRRAHLVARNRDGALLAELFTRDGAGAMVSAETYEELRRARDRDVGGILQLIKPLAEAGNLVERPRILLKRRIQDFIVAERDGTVVACAACHLFEDHLMAELAAIAVRPEYRQQRRGEQLLEVVERRAREAGMTRLFALTTRAEHWFLERGFARAKLSDLPPRRAAQVDQTRKSTVLIKPL